MKRGKSYYGGKGYFIVRFPPGEKLLYSQFSGGKGYYGGKATIQPVPCTMLPCMMPNDLHDYYKKRLLLRCIHHFKADLINNMDHMRISGTEPSSVILSILVHTSIMSDINDHSFIALLSARMIGVYCFVLYVRLTVVNSGSNMRLTFQL